MKTAIYLCNNRLWVSMEGRFLASDCRRVRESVAVALSPAVSEVWVDLSLAEFLDRSAIQLLAGIRNRCSRIKSRLRLIHPSARAMALLAASKLHEVFEIVPDGDLPGQEGFVRSPETLVTSIDSAEASDSGDSFTAENLRIASVSETVPATARTEPAEMCRRAAEALRRGDYEESVRLYRQAIELDGGLLAARNNLAVLCEQRRDLRPLAVDQWEALVRLSEQRGDHQQKERAERHLRALRNEPGGGVPALAV